jgi:hypothetical protein
VDRHAKMLTRLVSSKAITNPFFRSAAVPIV